MGQDAGLQSERVGIYSKSRLWYKRSLNSPQKIENSVVTGHYQAPNMLDLHTYRFTTALSSGTSSMIAAPTLVSTVCTFTMNSNSSCVPAAGWRSQILMRTSLV